MKNLSIYFGIILSLSLAVFFVACSKDEENNKYNCECMVTYRGQTLTVSMGQGDKPCKSLGFKDIVSHVGGDETDSSGYNWMCYDK